MSISINQQWQICFRWADTDAWRWRLSITTEDCSETKHAAMIEQQLRNPHPGEILKEEFLTEIGMNQNQLAHAIGVPGNRIHAIVNGSRDITADTDLRLCKFFGLSEGYSCGSRTHSTRWRRSAGSLCRLPKSSPTRRPEGA
jgi:antitoxin HigA-1